MLCCPPRWKYERAILSIRLPFVCWPKRMQIHFGKFELKKKKIQLGGDLYDDRNTQAAKKGKSMLNLQTQLDRTQHDVFWR